MEEYLANQLTAQEKAESETGTRWVLKAYDGQLIECVLLPREGVCVSTQVGCAVGCVFCMTGKSGLIRQLTDLEVAGQVQYAMRNAPVKKVVLMGMGEPSHNLRSVFSAVEHIVRYSGIGYKEVVISTVGDKTTLQSLNRNPKSNRLWQFLCTDANRMRSRSKSVAPSCGADCQGNIRVRRKVRRGWEISDPISVDFD